MHPGIVRAAVALLVVLAACSGCGSSKSSKVSTETYVRTVCSAIAPLERDVVSRTKALSNTTAPNAVEAKKTLRGFLAAVGDDADRAVTGIEAAGTPDISGGEAVAADIIRAFTQLRDAMHSAATKASSLPTDSPSSYKSAARALNASVSQSLNNIDASGLGNPAIEQAAAKEPVCKSLSN